jgi:hypothetical protein
MSELVKSLRGILETHYQEKEDDSTIDLLSESQETVITILNNMTDDSRLEIFNHYCQFCGRFDKDDRCYCGNDE